MKLRTFLVMVLLLGGLFALGSLVVANGEVLAQQVRLWSGASVSVGQLLILCFSGGVLVTVSVGLAHEIGLTVERWRFRRETRKTEEIEEEYSRGLVALLEGREDEALAHFRAVLERDSRHFNTLLKVGQVLRHQEKYAEAIEYHRKAHHIKEDNTRPLYALVEDYEAKGDMDRARSVLGQIIGINRSSVAAWRKLRSLHMKEGHWEKALEAHEKVRKLSHPDGAETVVDRRVGLGIRYEMAVARLEQGKAKEAVGLLRRILKDDGPFIPAHAKLGQALLELGQEGDAIQAWQHGFETTGSTVFLTLLEEHYLKRERPLAAIEALKLCIARVRKDTLARFYLGKLYFRLEMLDDAMSVLSSLEGRATYAPTLHYLLGRIHERRHQHREAVREYRKVIKEMELVQLEYKCRACGETLVEWSARCAACGDWNTIEVDFREEIPLEELGLSPAPIYTRP